jgi:hypothetical protein
MPAAFAYLVVPPRLADALDVEEVVVTARRELAGFAASEGYWLAGVFTDVQGRTETGLYAMLIALRRGRAVAVVVPDLGHLRQSGCLAGADLPTASRYLRARLLPMHPDPGERSDGSRVGGWQGQVDVGSAAPAAGSARAWWSYLALNDPVATGTNAPSLPSRGAHR